MASLEVERGVATLRIICHNMDPAPLDFKSTVSNAATRREADVENES